jgi:hypothetical protein
MADEHLPDGVRFARLRDGGDSFQVCTIIESGAGLMMPFNGSHEGYRSSILTLADEVLQGNKPELKKFFEADPKVNVMAFNCARATNQCREKEQYPQVVQDRQRSPLLATHTTEYTMVDFEDVVQQRKNRRRFEELERCRFRHKRSLFHNRTDPVHIRAKVRKPACRELLKAFRRTSIARYGQPQDGEITLVIMAGGNAEGTTYSRLDRFGKAWRRAEVLASTELCALHGHPVSAFRSKVNELRSCRRGNHSRLLRKPIRIVAKPLMEKVHKVPLVTSFRQGSQGSAAALC